MDADERPCDLVLKYMSTDPDAFQHFGGKVADWLTARGHDAAQAPWLIKLLWSQRGRQSFHLAKFQAVELENFKFPLTEGGSVPP